MTMPRRRGSPTRRVLPSEHRSVRRRILDVDAGEGTSAQPQADASENVRGRGRSAIPNIAITPRKRSNVIRGIRRSMGGLRPLDIGEYLKELEEEERRTLARERASRTGWTSSEDVSVGEDSEDEYLPPGAVRRRVGSSEGRVGSSEGRI